MPGSSGPKRPVRAFLAVLLVAVLGALAWTTYRTSRDAPPRREVLNPAGTRGRALVAYHPGLSDFQARVSRAFATGLAHAGWQVELVTATRSAPTDLSAYDLLAFGAPTYWWAPARPLQRYLGRLDLGGKPTVLLLTGAGATSRSLRILEGLIRGRHGTLAGAHVYFTMAPNREADYSWRTNKDVGVALAESAGLALPPPRP
jgi:hypothetical protein